MKKFMNEVGELNNGWLQGSALFSEEGSTHRRREPVITTFQVPEEPEHATQPQDSYFQKTFRYIPPSSTLASHVR
jgi:hypothetical protein